MTSDSTNKATGAAPGSRFGEALDEISCGASKKSRAATQRDEDKNRSRATVSDEPT